MALEEKEFTETNLNELIDIVEKDTIPTNKFTTQDTDRYVLLGKLNEIEQHLRDISALVSNSESKANSALEQSIKAVQSATNALNSSNTALNSSNSALATANSAIESANNALQQIVTAVDTSNEAKQIAQNALETINNVLNASNELANTVKSKSQITINGEHQDSVEFTSDPQTQINNKMDKLGAGTSTRVPIVYASGEQSSKPISNTSSNCIVTRKSNGRLYTPTPAEDTDCANKKYVDDAKAETTELANQAIESANNALNQVVSGIGTKVMVAGILQSVFDADTKANQSALDTTNTNVATNTSDIATLKTSKANQSDLDATNNSVANNTSIIDEIVPQVSKLVVETPIAINDLDERKANQSALDTTNTNVATNTSDIATLKTLTALWTGSVTSKGAINVNGHINNYKMIYILAKVTSSGDTFLQPVLPNKALISTWQIMANNSSNNRYFKFTAQLNTAGYTTLNITDIEAVTILGVYA